MTHIQLNSEGYVPFYGTYKRVSGKRGEPKLTRDKKLKLNKRKERLTANIGLAIWRLTCFYETFVQGSTAVILYFGSIRILLPIYSFFYYICILTF